MKRLLLIVASIVISLMFGSCGGDDPEPYPDITGLKSDIDKKFEALQADIKDLQETISLGKPPPVIEGAVPIEIKDPVEEVQDRTGGLPPTGDPIGKPVANPVNGVPVVGDGHIVFERGNGIHIMESNGAGIELIVALGADSHPALSPDGQRIAYSGFDDDSILVVRHIESGAEFRIDPLGGGQWHRFPAWSLDGKRLAYSSGSNIFITTVDAVNPNIVQITHDSSSNQAPCWSPDGKQIAYSSNLDGNRNIFAIGTDGRNRIRLTNHPGADDHPDWSPNGDQVAFMGDRDKDWYICLVNTSTFVETQLIAGIKPSWSPDGTKIAFVTHDIHIINVDGTGLTNLTNGTGGNSPDWQ